MRQQAHGPAPNTRQSSLGMLSVGTWPSSRQRKAELVASETGLGFLGEQYPNGSLGTQGSLALPHLPKSPKQLEKTPKLREGHQNHHTESEGRRRGGVLSARRRKTTVSITVKTKPVPTASGSATSVGTTHLRAENVGNKTAFKTDSYSRLVHKTPGGGKHP